MYIRKSSRTYEGKTYFNYVLVENTLTPRELYQKLRIGSEIIRPRKPVVELRRIVTKKSTSRFFSMSRPQKCGSWAKAIPDRRSILARTALSLRFCLVAA